MDILPGAHANVLIFLISFIRQILEWPIYLQNPETKRRIGMTLDNGVDCSECIRKSTNPVSTDV